MATRLTNGQPKSETPIQTICVGAAVATIRRREDSYGDSEYTASIVCVGNDERGEYINLSSFTVGELMDVSEVAERAHIWMHERYFKECVERRGSAS